MKIIDCEQGTPEWFQARAGKPTASGFDKILTTKGVPSKQAEKYLYRLAGEAVTGIPEESYQNVAMLRGKEMEAEARKFYEFKNDVEIVQIGFCLSDDGYGCSPDGLVGKDGLLEIKCPLMSTHVGYLLNGTLPTEYFQQTQGQLLVTGRKWLDFLSYYPGIKPLLVRVERDEKFIKLLKTELEGCCNKIYEIVQAIKEN